MQQVEYNANKQIHLAVKHAAVAAVRTLTKNYIVYTDKRKSTHKSNIAGQQIKIARMYNCTVPSTDIAKAVNKAIAQYNCIAIAERSRCRYAGVKTYIKIMRK